MDTRARSCSTCRLAAWGKMRVLMTLVDGEPVYQDPAPSR
jgi:hypothetical protein